MDVSEKKPNITFLNTATELFLFGCSEGNIPVWPVHLTDLFLFLLFLLPELHSEQCSSTFSNEPLTLRRWHAHHVIKLTHISAFRRDGPALNSAILLCSSVTLSSPSPPSLHHVWEARSRREASVSMHHGVFNGQTLSHDLEIQLQGSSHISSRAFSAV